MVSPLDVSILPLLQTVFTSILEVFLLCLAGYILAGKGILDKKTQKQLNRLNVSLFTPSLLFSKVAFFLSPEKLRELWIIPLFFVIVTVISMGTAYILGTIFRLRRSQRAFAMAAAMFMNSNSLPIALMQSLVVTVHGLKWGTNDNKNAMLGRALTYLVLYSTLGMVLRWSYGVRLLSQADDEVVKGVDDSDETTPLLRGANSEATLSNSSRPVRPTLLTAPERRRSRFYNSFPNSPNQSRVDLPTIESEGSSIQVDSPEQSDTEYSDNDAGVALPQHQQRRTSISTTTFSRRCGRRVVRWWAALNEFMTVPLWAALASVIVALIQPLQHTLDMHMQPVKGALTSAGNCSIPLTLIVLGAYFYPNADGSDADRKSLLQNIKSMLKRRDHSTPKAESRPGETKTVVIAVAARMILTPLLLFPLMFLAAKFDWQAVFADPVFVVANVLLVSSPPALTLAQITQAASGDAFERLISRTIFWSYCIVTPPATIFYVVIGLILAKI
ncbi:auxin efflux carrier [Cylindrobasidium torrendii FP15055 ss-10]|uniref:Auxin efflux carrier n=1 Tax=Cylindrobasidium torrendii FP15055 ss-10 TaxID=1314674 RepID=A0A0D7B304_9AGAR|nr:auxin efflux carrier [Cylindrobasidium torrendii FP15055 ss-10]